MGGTQDHHWRHGGFGSPCCQREYALAWRLLAVQGIVQGETEEERALRDAHVRFELSACKVISLSIPQDALLLQDFQISGLAINSRQGLTDCDSWSACMWMPHILYVVEVAFVRWRAQSGGCRMPDPAITKCAWGSVALCLGLSRSYETC